MTARLTDLYTTYAPLVFRRCKAVLRNEDEAWDGVQEIFLRLAERFVLVEGMESPTAYLYRAATHYALNRLKREGRSASLPDEEAQDHRGETDDDWVRSLFLEHLFAQVPDRTRELAWYRWVDRMTWEEVALAAGLSVAGVRKHLAKFTTYARAYKEHV